MSDKKLSSVSAVSDMNFVYAETASGETVKISKADLASVVAELIPVSTRYDKGLLNGGVRVYTGEIGVGAGGVGKIPEKIGGLLFVKNGMSWGGYNMFYVYMNRLIVLGSPDGYNPVASIDVAGGYVSITNASSEWRTYKYVLINISSTNDTSDYVGD